MPRLPPKVKQVCEDEIMRRWHALNAEWRQIALTFCDELLVERLGTSFTTLLENNRRMRQMGISIAGTAAANSRLADPSLLISCFHMSKKSLKVDNIADDASDDESPIFFIDLKFVEDDTIIERCRAALPDFLRLRSGRRAMPQARWKDLFARDPASVTVFQQQLAKLIEQAFWAIEIEEIVLHEDQIVLEPWMEDVDSKPAATASSKGKASRKKNRKQKSQNNKVDSSPVTPSTVATESCLLDDVSTRADDSTPMDSDNETENAAAEEYDAASCIDDAVESSRQTSMASDGWMRQMSSLSGIDTTPSRQLTTPASWPFTWSGCTTPLTPYSNQWAVAAIVHSKNTFLHIIEGDELTEMAEMASCSRRRSTSVPPLRG